MIKQLCTLQSDHPDKSSNKSSKYLTPSTQLLQCHWQYFLYFTSPWLILYWQFVLRNSFYLFFWDFIYSFLERGEEKEKERERNISVWLLLECPVSGTWPATQACALMGNWTGDPLVHSPYSIHWATPVRALLTFLPIPSTPSHLVTINFFSLSRSLFLFYLLIYFVF